jgi:hypothetical protein
MWGVIAISSILTGDTQTALDAANSYTDTGSAHETGPAYMALAQIALGDLEQAQIAARQYARGAVIGRLLSQATDCLTVLAALAKAEGDTPSARDLVANMGLCQQFTLVAFSRHLAQEVDVTGQFEANQATVLADQTAMGQRAGIDLQTLRHEITRRGWT